MNKIKEFFQKYGHARVLIVFILLYTWYFFVCRIFPDGSYHPVHSPLDDKIPFIPAFILFYILWYPYISLPLIWLMFKSREDFLRMAMFLFIGMGVCHVVFLVYPTYIDFRGAAEAAVAGKPGFLAWVCRVIYSSDLPRNVLPSMHCFESVAVHVTLCYSETGRRYKWIRPISLAVAVLICISTVFIKQHSIIDAVVGIALAVPVGLIVYLPKWKFLQKKTQDGASDAESGGTAD